MPVFWDLVPDPAEALAFATDFASADFFIARQPKNLRPEIASKKRLTLAVPSQGQKRKIITIPVVADVEVAWEASAGKIFFIPGSVSFLGTYEKIRR